VVDFETKRPRADENGELERDGVGASTRAKSYRLLSRIVGTAIESGYLARNPCTIRGAAAEPAPEMRFATVAEVAALAGAIPQRFRALVLVAAYTGLRWGELAGLRVKRVDLLHGRITVAEQLLEVRGRLAFGPTKTGAGLRTVTLPTVAAEALAEHLSVYAEGGPEGLVFPAERGGPIRRSNFTRRVWIPATRAAGIEGLRFHDLRHTAATLAVAGRRQHPGAAGAAGAFLLGRRPALPARHGRAGRRHRSRSGRADPGRLGAFGGLGRRWEWHAGGTSRATPPESRPPMIGRDGRELGSWLVGLPGLEPGTSSLSGIEG
jgi:integrase